MSAVYTDPLILEIMARTDKLERSIRSARAQFTTEADKMQRSSEALRRSIETNSDAAGAAFKRIAASVGAAFSAQQVAGLIDGYTRFTNQLKVAGLEGENLARVQETLFGIAQRYGVELESVGTLYGRTAAAAKELGLSHVTRPQTSRSQYFRLFNATRESRAGTAPPAWHAQPASTRIGYVPERRRQSKDNPYGPARLPPSARPLPGCRLALEEDPCDGRCYRASRPAGPIGRSFRGTDCSAVPRK